MSERPNVVTTFRDMAVDEDLREALEGGCRRIAEEFPEVSRMETTISEDGASYAVNGHVTTKGHEVSAHAQASEPGPAADRWLDKIERQLRTLHDKRIFTQRREAQRHPPKKRGTA